MRRNSIYVAVATAFLGVALLTLVFSVDYADATFSEEYSEEEVYFRVAIERGDITYCYQLQHDVDLFLSCTETLGRKYLNKNEIHFDLAMKYNDVSYCYMIMDNSDLRRACVEDLD